MASEIPYGQRLVPTVIDETAQKKPDKIYAKVPFDEADLTKGFKDITFVQIANAINAASWWLESTLGKSSPFETFAYLGLRDLRYPILIAAAAKVQRKVLLSSLLASLDAHVDLIVKTECKTVVHTLEHEGLARSIQQILPEVSSVVVPNLEEWLHSSVSHYSYIKSFGEAEYDPVFIVHTSGTTGVPKSVVYTHGHLSTIDTWRTLPDVDGIRPYAVIHFSTSISLYCSLPIFHVFGIIFTLLFPVFSDTTLILGPASGPPSLKVTEAVLDHANPDGGIFPPFLLETIAREPVLWAKLKALRLIVYGGAPLSIDVGDELAKSTALWSGFGTTEGGGLPTLEVAPEDWQYTRFHPDVGATFEEQADLGLHELVYQKSRASNQAHGLFRTYPDLEFYRSKDLFKAHPTKAGLYKYVGRTDDLVILTGEVKLYGRGIEEAVKEHWAVKDVLVGGDGRIRPFMLIELADPEVAGERVLEGIRQRIEVVNQHNAETARIEPDLIIFATKPFARTAKATIEKAKTLALYQATIDELYAALE